jgi:hypothetical protein
MRVLTAIKTHNDETVVIREKAHNLNTIEPRTSNVLCLLLCHILSFTILVIPAQAGNRYFPHFSHLAHGCVPGFPPARESPRAVGSQRGMKIAAPHGSTGSPCRHPERPELVEGAKNGIFGAMTAKRTFVMRESIKSKRSGVQLLALRIFSSPCLRVSVVNISTPQTGTGMFSSISSMSLSASEI